MSSGLELSNVRVAYGSRVVLEDVCVSCGRGKILGLVGPNGAGKSTLLKSVLDLVPRVAGAVTLDGQPLRGARMKTRVACVPQRNDVDWGFPINVEEVVLLGCQGRLGLCGRPGPAERAAALAALDRLGMSNWRRVQIGELSGGQQQRVFLARALAQGGDTLLLDEPLSGLDNTTHTVVLGLLDELRVDGQTIVIATHDLAEAAQLCDSVCMIQRRIVALGPPREVLTPPNLQLTWASRRSDCQSDRLVAEVVRLLAAPLQFELTRNALGELTLVGLACGALGVLVVLRGLSFIGDALGHCAVPGVVVAYLIHNPIEPWGLCAALVSGWGMTALRRTARLNGDAAIAVMFSSSFAVGLALISSSRSYLTDLTEILFGNVLGVDSTDLVISAASALLILVLLVVCFRPLVLVAFDPISAQALGLPTAQLDLLLFGLIALAIVSGAVAAGSLLVAALLVVPGATARFFAGSVRGQMLCGALLGCLAGWIGVYASYYWRLASGGSVVLASVVLFGVGLGLAAVNSRRGLWWRSFSASS